MKLAPDGSVGGVEALVAGADERPSGAFLKQVGPVLKSPVDLKADLQGELDTLIDYSLPFFSLLQTCLTERDRVLAVCLSDLTVLQSKVDDLTKQVQGETYAFIKWKFVTTKGQALSRQLIAERARCMRLQTFVAQLQLPFSQHIHQPEYSFICAATLNESVRALLLLLEKIQGKILMCQLMYDSVHLETDTEDAPLPRSGKRTQHKNAWHQIQDICVKIRNFEHFWFAAYLGPTVASDTPECRKNIPPHIHMWDIYKAWTESKGCIV